MSDPNAQNEDRDLKSERWLVAALYKFVSLPDFDTLREPIRAKAEACGLVGTLLLAGEGINGTIAGTENELRSFLAWLRVLDHKDLKPFTDLVHKESWADSRPFLRMKVRLKREIVTMGVEGIDPNRLVGTYVKPDDWNALIEDPDTIVVDTRNDYEVAIGTFQGAKDPRTKTFREFPAWAKKNLDEARDRKIAMFCTGGIRCEKSTAFLKEQGFENVFHLEGGILKYLETVPEEESLWQGECFVFDSRVSVGHGLVPGEYTECFACRMPLSPEETCDPAYVKGVSCPHCIDRMSDADRQRFRERQRQVELARKRGEDHLGSAGANSKRSDS